LSNAGVTVTEGDILAGKYRIDRVLGVGGMGVVVAAHHLRLDERVAIKFLLPEGATSGESVARFEREARAAVKIKSEHVARVSDVGTLDNGAPYMVMEYLEGDDLSVWLKQRAPLPFEQVADFVLQASEAIAEAHALGIVHRDLKPANLFVIKRPDGALSVKVLDFGISKMRGTGGSRPESSITRTAALMGSPLYMSPEQLTSPKDVDMRSDIWAIGIILYELLSGVSPFAAETLPELVAKVLSRAPTSLRKSRPDVPPGLEAVILRCIERDPARRYQSVGQLAADLLPFASPHARLSLERISGVLRSSGLSATALSSSSSSSGASGAATLVGATGGSYAATQSAWGGTSTPRRQVSLALAVAGVLLVGAAAVFHLRRSDSETVSSAAAQASMAPPRTPEMGAPIALSFAPLADTPPTAAPPASAPTATGAAVGAPAAAAPAPALRAATKVSSKPSPAPAARPEEQMAVVPPAVVPPKVAGSPARKDSAFDDRK
jgi:eukaryotic-like serine/threonine-protein kinase